MRRRHAFFSLFPRGVSRNALVICGQPDLRLPAVNPRILSLSLRATVNLARNGNVLIIPRNFNHMLRLRDAGPMCNSTSPRLVNPRGQASAAVGANRFDKGPIIALRELSFGWRQLTLLNV